MFRFSQLASQLVAFAAIGIYLAAAFLPCEPSAEERSALATALSRGTAHAAASSLTSAHAGHQGHAGHGAQGHAASPSRPSLSLSPPSSPSPHASATHDHSAHAHAHEAPAPAARNAKSVGAPSSEVAASGGESGEVKGVHARLVLKAKCECGCERTRSQVGGGAARLGFVVLADYATGIPPAPRVVPEDRVLARWVEMHFEADHVPI